MLLIFLVLGYYVINSYKNLGETIPVLDDDKYLTTVNSISAIFNSLRFIWSGALDKLCFKKVYGCLIFFQLLIAFSVTFTEQSRVSFAAMICLTLFCIGGHFALFPNVLKRIYGKQGTVLYGVLFTGTGLASLMIVGLLFSPIGDMYTVLFYFFGVLQVVALLILIFFYKEGRFEPDWSDIFQLDIMLQSKRAASSQSKQQQYYGGGGDDVAEFEAIDERRDELFA